MATVVQKVDNLTLFCCYYIVAGQFGQSLLQLDSSQSTLKSQMQDQAKLLNEVDIVKSINALCIIVRDSEIPYNTQDQKNETQHPQFITEGTVPSSVLLMYKLAREQTLLLREVTRERHARSLAAWLASLATQCVGIAWHRHQRDCWNKTEHYYTHCAHLIPKRKACLQVTVTRRCLSCCYFSYYGCLPFFCELSCLNAQLKHFFPFFQLEASFTANVAAIEANCARVEARMNALLEKFETKGR